MTMNRPLFRQEALEAQQDQRYGAALLARSPSTALLTITAVFVAAVIVGFAVWGQYTRKEHVIGYLAPTRGLIKLFTPQIGAVLEKRVTEGQTVKQGDVLLIISSERATATTHEAQASILSELRGRRESLQQEQVKQDKIDTLVAHGLAERIRSLELEIGETQAQLDLYRRRIASAEQTVKRHEQLVASHFVAEATLQQKQEELLDQRNQLANAQRTLTGLTRELSAARVELAASDLKQANTRASIERQISELEQQLTEADSHRAAVLTAPVDGVVTTILAEVGQTANPNAPLLSILPAGAELEAHLLVPTHAAGFIKSAQSVALRYQAFPYQRFGHHLGEVVEVGRTVLLPNESNLPVTLQEPVYRVIVRLPAQQVLAYGQSMALQAGMMLDADVRIDRRRLIEWLFDPVLALLGRV